MSNATIDADHMQASATRACALLRSLAHRHRLMLLCQLRAGERCVGELEELLDIRQPSLSQQLGVLRNEGLVETRREGKRIYYRIASSEALRIIETLYALFCRQTDSRRRK